jgi:hypothetical protein
MSAPHLPDEVVKQVNITKIVTRDYGTLKRPGIIWAIPLFSDTPVDTTSTPWDWVEKYRGMFSALKPEARGDKAGTLKKMQNFFSQFPDVRVDEIFAATEMYLNTFKTNQQSVQYLQQADYFISKINKGEKSSRLSTFIELTRELKAQKDVLSSDKSRFNNQVKQ